MPSETFLDGIIHGVGVQRIDSKRYVCVTSGKDEGIVVMYA